MKVQVRLRPGKDDDIQKALEEAVKCLPEDKDRSDIIRAALRAFLLPKQTNSPATQEVTRLPGGGIQLRIK